MKLTTPTIAIPINQRRSTFKDVPNTFTKYGLGMNAMIAIKQNINLFFISTILIMLTAQATLIRSSNMGIPIK